MRTERKLMHIDRADEIAVARKAAGAARPISPIGLVFVPAAGTPAACSSFRAGRARDAGVLGFMSQVVDVTTVFPQRHALVVMPAGLPIAHAVRVADEERSDFVLHAEVDDGSSGLVSQITDASLGTPTHLVLGALQLLPAPGVFGTTALLLGKLPKLFAALAFEGTDAAPGHDSRRPGTHGHGGQVDFPEIDCCLDDTGCFFRLWYLNADMQLKASVPDQSACPAVRREVKRQHKEIASFAHRQDHAPLFPVDGLGRPPDRVKLLRAPGILHAHLRALFAQDAGRFDGAEKGAGDLLHRLSVECKLSPPRGLMQLAVLRPLRMGHPRLLVRLHAEVPHARRFHLRLLEAAEERRRQIGQVIHANCLHVNLFFFPAAKAAICP
jgi:hypothetical protein